MLRKFKLRNGMIVEEWPTARKPVKPTMNDDGYISYYKIIALAGVETELKNNKWLCLKCYGGQKGFPTGGVHGPGFDIVKEIK